MKKLLYVCLPLSFIGCPAFAQEQVLAPDTAKQASVTLTAWDSDNQTKPDREASGAITWLSTQGFNKGPIIYSSLQLIQGRVPGLAIMRTGGGDPLQDMPVQLRGISTLYGSTDLLYVIDGVAQASLNILMPEDIESIQVLRSASATAAYGIRGANGVILVTTKKGRLGKPVISYGAYGYFETVSKKVEFLTGDEWRQLKQEWAGSSNPGLQQISTGMGEFGATTDWLKAIRQRKLSQVHHLSVSGATATTRYYAAANYRNLNGAVARSGSNLFNGRLSLSHLALRDKLKLDASLSITPQRYSQYRNSLPDGSGVDLIDRMENYNPTVAIDSTQDRLILNPIVSLKSASHAHKRIDWLASAGASYRIVKGLTLKAMLAQQHLQNKLGYRFFLERPGVSVDEVWKHKHADKTTTLETALAYHFSSASHHMSIQAGYVNQHFGTTSEQRDTVRHKGVVSETSGRDFRSRSRITSLLGSARYSYKDRYLLSADLRRDESLRYNGKYTPRYYPAYNLGWRVGNEPFLRKASFLSQLMLRAGYGVSGRQLDFPGEFSGNTLPNLAFHGEKLSEVNCGADIGFAADGLSVHVDYYDRLTHDVIVDIFGSVPGGQKYMGTLNGGKLSNRGWEVSVNARPVATNAFAWSWVLTASFNRNQLMFGIYQHLNSLTQGQPVGMMYKLPFAGFDQNGKAQYWTKAGGRKDAQSGEESDLIALGNGAPKTHFGFNNNLTYRKLELTLLLRGAAGFQIHNRHRAENVNAYLFRSNQLGEVKELDYNVMHNSSLLASRTDYFIEQGDFVKIDNLTLSYALTLKGKFVQHVKVYASGHNLATFTRFKGLDPEMAGITGTAPGVYERNSYFATRVWSLGVNASL